MKFLEQLGLKCKSIRIYPLSDLQQHFLLCLQNKVRHLSICPFVRLSICSFVHLSVCPSVRLIICLSLFCLSNFKSGENNIFTSEDAGSKNILINGFVRYHTLYGISDYKFYATIFALHLLIS